ncbi:queuosine salvage family protein [Patescibacteria group bacterium]|nr:queuosine salvage family protein [Patescibacteria group bacterium]
MVDVLSSTKRVLGQSRNVKIDLEAIHSLVSDVKKEDLRVSEIGLAKKQWTFDNLLQIIFVFNTVNFCFWAGKDEKKWTVQIDGEELDGSIALFRCIEKEVEKNPDFLAGDELADLSRSHLRRILAGNVQIPLFEERLNCLNEAGKVLEKRFGNSFIGVYEKAGNDALALANLLIKYFPCFDDISEYKGEKMGFYKRAQLNSKMVSDTLVASGKGKLRNLDKLTAFADYKIPQILRNLGVIKYSKELAEKIDRYELIKKGSEEEVEIRATTVWAVELIRRELQKRYSFVTASHVDSMLWNMSQTKAKGEKPYHRTLTAAY